MTLLKELVYNLEYYHNLFISSFDIIMNQNGTKDSKEAGVDTSVPLSWVLHDFS